MSLIEQLSAALAPHTAHIAERGEHRLHAIEQTLREIRQQGDLGRPDTGDAAKYVIVNGAIAAGRVELAAGEQPTVGEAWILQQVITNGKGPKSPAFVIRTNTGRLLFSAEGEQNTTQNVGGNALLRPGETIIIESAGGSFDFIMAFTLRKEARQQPDAGYGMSEEVFEPRARGEHEVERDALAPLGNAATHAPSEQPDTATYPPALPEEPTHSQVS